MSAETNVEAMIGTLFRLANPKTGDRGAMAILRRSLNSEEFRIRAAAFVFPHIPEEDRSAEKVKAYLATAGFFALWAHASVNAVFFPGASNENEADNAGAKWVNRTVGHMLRALVQENEEAMERRFTVLVNAREEEFMTHLRRSFGLLRSAKSPIPLDFRRLWNDLYWWDTPRGENVRLDWARGFYPYQPTTQGDNK